LGETMVSLRMIQAFKASGLPSTERLVAYMLADHHNEDTGRCDPSVMTLMDETGLSERAIRYALKRIAAAGHVTIRATARRNIYVLHPCTKCTPAPNAPVHDVPPTPAPNAPLPLHHVQDTPAPRASEPEGTRTTTRKKPEVKTREARPPKTTKRDLRIAEAIETTARCTIPPELATPEFLAAWSEWCQHRERLAADDARKAWTPLASSNLLRECQRKGEPWALVEIRHALSNSWQGVQWDQRRNPADVRSQPLLPGVNGNHRKPIDRMEKVEFVSEEWT